MVLYFFCCMPLDDQSVALLEEFTADPEPLVSQSCQVALSMLEFERSGKSFEVRTLVVTEDLHIWLQCLLTHLSFSLGCSSCSCALQLCIKCFRMVMPKHEE